MASIFRRAAAGVGCLALGLALGHCAGEGDDSEARKKSAECLACHERETLVSGSMLSQRDHMSEMGKGFSTGGAGGYFGLSLGGSPPVVWVGRGRHSPGDLESCGSCHARHGSFSYPAAALEFDARIGADCAAGCHEWLGSVKSAGFTNGSGAAGSFEGSIRPFDLLSSAGNRHARLWRGGFDSVFPDAAMKIVGIRPGCSGCHNVFAGEHGAVPSCTECHGFSGAGSRHDAHVGIIEAQGALGGPGHAGERACAYCHAGFSADERFRASCYGCHLSAHDPATPYWPE